MDRLDIIDPKKVELQKLIKAIPWDKFIEYGWVKIKISNGKPTLITVEQSDRIE
ncbi:MAG: hypothetical protein MUP81_05405 [Dehalococcoidia bacterium]|nr:hypothetical protein [Dehalococcoidia bacterium]